MTRIVLAELHLWCLRGLTSHSTLFSLNSEQSYILQQGAWFTDLQQNSSFLGQTVRYSIISSEDFGHSKDTTDTNGKRAPDIYFFTCTL